MSTFDDIIGADIALGSQSMWAGAPQNIWGTEYGQYGGALMVGADPSAMQAQNQAAFVRNLAARHAAAVVPRPATKAREYPLGFPTTSLTTAAATQTVSTQPQVPFRGRRLIVPSDIAGSILINDLKVGKNSMFATANPVPARGFTEFGVGVDLNLDTAQISQLISLNVTNTSGATISFNAMLIGTAVE